ncbi:hypothetical protein KVR01_012051 [Diaporthe batatas]|uniref:uncharacterized protein n=1 Tax=Diaporthe batatas TaxID=748121 RepID=UPI001D038BD3|nr:uncharacterized protein KVR01_012051 [Diaporthe batatas]KAG8158290.1 hypothetical protein KVR01_012051 [Diaporthe batatas]
MSQDVEQEAADRSADLGAMETGLFSDCTITCGTKTWNLNRATLCSRSAWFTTALTSLFQEGQQATVNIDEQDEDAVEVCLKYIYGGVAAIDMAEELNKRGRQPILFCAEVYRSADFFLVKPLYTLVEHYLGNYLDSKIKWMYILDNAIDDFYKEQKAREWTADLKDAILEVERWNTPVINNMLKEFVWAGKSYFLERFAHAPHISLRTWFRKNMPQYVSRVQSLCNTADPVWRTESTGPT